MQVTIKKLWHVIKIVYHMFYSFNGVVKLVILSVYFTACLGHMLFHVFVSSFELVVRDGFLLSTPFESAIGIFGFR